MILMEEKKEIKRLVLNDGEQITGVPYRDITPYHENGQMASVVWFEVVGREGNLEQKVNSAHVRQVIY